MKKRTLSFFLCLAMVISLFVQAFPAAVAAEADGSVAVLRAGEPVSEISITREEKTTLTASFAGEGDCQWQILLSPESDQWVDIYDKTAPDCEVSYALVKNLLDDSGSAYLRCAVTGETTVYSDPVCVNVLPGEQTAVESVGVEPVLTEALTLLMPATTGVEERVGDEVLQGELPRPEEDSAPDTEFAPTAEEEAVAADVAAFLAGLDVASEEEITVDAQAPVLYDNGDGTEETDYVTITINYYDYLSAYPTDPAETPVKKEVYSPYVATLPYGAAFTQTVVSPTYLGFAPYYDPDGGENITTDASKIELNYAENVLTEDVSFDVYYKAIPVPYGIRYFFQNINDDMYSENIGLYRTDKAETGTIVSDDKLAPTAESLAQVGMDLEGFEKLYHYPTAVAADGSTVFECYYDRNYYLIQFDLAGGYGVDPIYARYDAAIAVNDPTRHGYIFAGWKLTGIDTNHDGDWEEPVDMSTDMIGNIPAYDCLYTAQWETVNTTATVVFWLQNADPDKDDNGHVIKDDKGNPVYGYSYWGSESYAVKSNTVLDGNNDDDNSPIVEANKDWENYSHAEYNADKTADESDVTIEGDGSSVINVYYDRKAYTLKFYYAMSSGSGQNTKYYVIGGSTYYFGASAGSVNKADEVALLDQYMSTRTSERGEVDEIPTLNDKGKSRNYTTGTDSSTVNRTEYTYYYISFNAKYGADISELWPCDVFNSVTRTGGNTHGYWSGTEAFVSAWNGEHHVLYSQDSTINNGNQTIKGNYEKLDDNLLWHSKYDEPLDGTVTYLCFWENGANIYWSVPELYRYKIWLPVMENQDTEDLTTKVNNGVTYYLDDYYDTCDDSDYDHQTQPSLEGFGKIGYDWSKLSDFDTTLYKEAYEVNFYYSRNLYTLEFHNVSEIIEDETKYVSYGQSLASYKDVEPSYPATLEADAYNFAGWYTSPECVAGTEVDWNGTMPANDMIVYANWEKVTHTVNFFSTLEEMEAYEAAQEPKPYAVRTVEHGQIITQQVEDPKKKDEHGNDLVFAGWFYLQNGAEKAYTPLSMPVNRDLNVYAKWSSHMPQPYRISYVLKGTDIKVADDTYGFAYNGTTRTFTAKAGDPYNQLYPDYNKGYFPTVGSHSITMAVEHDLNEDGKVYYDDVQLNSYTFEYVKAGEIDYRVEYRDATTGEELKSPEKKTTNKAVVTERFVPIENYTPDAIYKKLVLEVELNEEGEYVGTENNVIVFYYSNSNVGRVAVHHMTEDLTDGQYTEYAYEEVTGNNDNTIYVDSLKIPGFALSDVKPAYYELRDKQGNVTERYPSWQEEGGIIRYPVPVNEFGTELYIYYDRLSYPYVVHYYEYNTIEPLGEDKTGAAPFGAEVEEEAIKIEGYTCVSQTTQTITVRQETDTNNDGVVDVKDTIANNVITFYYSPAKYTVKYVNTTPGGGVLSLEQEIVTGSMDFTGSKPTAGAYYKFDGWYLDEACTQAVNSAAEGTTATIGEDMTLVPVKAKLSDTEDNIFYAKFERLTGPLTIARTSTDDTDRVFVYDIRDNQTGAVITVTVVGDGETAIPDMPLGDYTVTQKNDWSWRHSDNATTKEHNNTAGTTYTFGGSASASWLDGVSELIQNVKGG